MIIANGEPDKGSSTGILRLSGHSIGASSPYYKELLSELTAKVTKSTNQDDINCHRKCRNHILTSLALCFFRFELVSLPTNPDNFIDGEYLRWLGYSRKRMQRCIYSLVENDVMVLGREGFKAGNTFGTRAQASQYYPTDDFIRHMCHSLYHEYGDFNADADDDLYRFKDFSPEDMHQYVIYQSKIERSTTLQQLHA
jgi:hypothetical protein